MQLLVIGPGCSKCKTLAQFTEQAVKELGVTAEINKVTDLKQIMALGVMMTPALAVNGTIKVEGVCLIPTYSHPAETFWRQLKFGEFEIAEMSMSSYLIARSQGADMIALPAFPSRRRAYRAQDTIRPRTMP